MIPGDETRLVGLAALEAVTELLQRRRRTDPTAGLFEAADFQWWWRNPRPTDDVPNLFWYDADGRPAAALMVTAWGDRIALDPIVLPGVSAAAVMARGLAHAAELGLGSDAGHDLDIGLEVDPDDAGWCDVLTTNGFVATDDHMVEAWLDLSSVRPPDVSALADGYRLATRADTTDRPHHMINAARGHTDPEPRLRQTSLYRADLDLVVVDARDEVAAYGLFWYDPTTATGLVEPMRTEDSHQRRGLARHVLTAGVARLAAAGAQRIKICYEPDNPASGHLYRSVGFEPHRETTTYVRPASRSAPG